MKTITGQFDTLGQAKNAHEDLIDTGIPAEKVYLDRDAFSVKVMMPDATASEVKEILGRHQPKAIEAHDS
jgi:hypothetical protein